MTLNFEPGTTFTRQPLLNTVNLDQETEWLALTYLDKWAPDVTGMIMGGVL